jgi:tetratricopeptide (TPR) repeat protein
LPPSQHATLHTSVEVIAGRYHVEAELGKGGMARVFRARESSTGRLLALKRLQNQSTQIQELFEAEYQTLASLRHPRIVEVFDYGRDAVGAFYTMELLEGEDLTSLAPLSWKVACGYLRDAAEALGLLHARKLIHRDVSPRNLWRTREGRVKLIDFGVVSPFGPSEQVLGTPPLVPPEALEGKPLDQRSDLYALGAVAYYLLTGAHAYPARTLSDLSRAWQRTPVPPSRMVLATQREDLLAIPPELDRLVSMLLSRDPFARPGSAGEVIDLLDGLLGDAAPELVQPDDVQVPAAAFVGRLRERRSLRRQLALAARGRAQSALIESESGLGRTRLLYELSLWSRIANAAVLHVDAAVEPGHFGVANALALKLLDVLPEPARACAAPHAGTLAHLSPRVAARLGAQPGPVPEIFGELNVQLQAALRDWFAALATQHALVVLVDGLELADENSAAFLLTLALKRRGTNLLLVCSLLREGKRAVSPVASALGEVSHRLVLRPLAPAESVELLHSLFGDAEHLPRFASRMDDVSRGNPAHLLELVTQLVRRAEIRIVNGSWLLPAEPSAEILASSRDEARLARLALLSPAARTLGGALGVLAEAVPLELAQSLAAMLGSPVSALSELLTAEVLAETESGLRFAHGSLRQTLLSELAPEPRARAQRALADHLLERPDAGAIEQVKVGLLWLESGDERGAALVNQACVRIALHEGDKLAQAMPWIERALLLRQAQGRPRRELVAMLAPLCIGGYYVDRGYGERHGELALASLHDLIGLRIARRLRGVLGGKLSLLVGLIIAGTRAKFRGRDPLVPSFADLLTLLFSCVVNLVGCSVACLDPQRGQQRADVVKPFAVLGHNHIAGLTYELCSALVDTVSDRPAATVQRWTRMLERLEKGGQMIGLPPNMMRQFKGGADFARGVLEAHGEGDAALRAAERLDAFGQHHYTMTAQQLRVLHYANHGDRKRFEEYRKQVEYHAIQSGSMWQYEAWIGAASIAIYLRMRDAMGLKRTAEQMARLARSVPSFDVHARVCRGTYLLMRKRYAEALPWLEVRQQSAPGTLIGWGHTMASIARAHNGLGQYERARSVCQRALEQLPPGDLQFTAFNLGLQTERLVAEAGLGNAEQAARELEALIARHEPQQGALTLYELHEAGVKIALLQHETAAFERHVQRVLHWAGVTGLVSLGQHAQELVAILAKGSSGLLSSTAATESTDGFTLRGEVSSEGTGLTVERMLAGGSMTVPERCQRALTLLADSSGASSGFLYLVERDGVPRLAAALRDERPSPVLTDWLNTHAMHTLEDEHTQMLEDEDEDDDDGATHRGVLEEGGRGYRVLDLLAAGAPFNGVAGFVIVGSADGVPPQCPLEILSAVGHHLQRAMTRSQET